MTFGQVSGFSKALPNILPYINAFAQKPEKAMSGDEALTVLSSLGVRKSNDGSNH